MNFLFSRPGALSIAMNGALVLAVLLIVLFRRLKKRLRSKHWKPVTATVLRIQAVDPRIGKDTVGPRKYRLDLVFDWQGLDWHRSWYFPRTYDLPQAGDTLSLLYNQKEEQFQLQPDPEETRKIARLRRRFLFPSNLKQSQVVSGLRHRSVALVLAASSFGSASASVSSGPLGTSLRLHPATPLVSVFSSSAPASSGF